MTRGIRRVMTEAEDRAFATLWRGGSPAAELMEIFGLASPSTVSSVARRLELPKRVPKRGSAAAAKPTATVADDADEQPRVPRMAPHPYFTAERDLALILTRGVYRDIEALAARWGRPLRSVIQRWHQLRAT